MRFPEFIEVLVDFLLSLFDFLVQLFDVLVNGCHIDSCFFLEGVDVARDVEIELVLLDLLRGRNVAILINLLAGLISRENLVDMFKQEDILILVLLELIGGINEEDVGVHLTLLEDEDGCRNACAIEEVVR